MTLIAALQAPLDEGSEHFAPSHLEFTSIDVGNTTVNLIPGEARAHVALANLYAQQLGQPARAREHYLRLLELDPQHPQATAIRYWLEANP